MLKSVCLVLCVLAAAAFAAVPAHAVPSYAREMQVQCQTCHTLFPQLNAFGRQFKLSGYMLSAQSASGVKGTDESGRTSLTLDSFPPLSVMLQTAYTNLQTSVPDSQNDNVQLPQEASLFVAGRIAPGLGSFLQLTYSQEDGQIGLDNAELRYSKTAMLRGKPVTYGAVLNNNPTIEDLWNSTPVWGFPWTGPDAAPEPAAAALIDEGLAQDVMGLGGYASFNGKFYVASTLYRSAHIGSTSPGSQSENTVKNAALYWRFAWQHAVGMNYFEVGGYGLHARLVPEGIAGQTDDYDDISADVQFERPIGSRRLLVHGAYTDERQDLNASLLAGAVGRQHYDLHSLRLDAGLYGPRLAYVLGYLSTDGAADAVRFGPDAVDGSANGQPDTAGWLGEIIYSPWQNVQLRVQYRMYHKFNGASRNYDGFGRDAADNDTLYLQAWLAW